MMYAQLSGYFNPGRLKLANTGLVFKSTKTGITESLTLSEIESTQWMRVARGFRLKLMLKNGQVMLYDGFKEAEYEKLRQFISKNFEMSLEEIELSVKGWNWGTAKFNGGLMTFEVDKKPAFELPLKDISQSTTGKNEVTLEFHRNDDAKVTLMEMRFYVPPSSDGDVDSVEEFNSHVQKNAEIIQAVGEAIITFPEIACLTPRGRYTMKVYPTFLQLHGKTYDFNIPHTSILRLFLLPHQDNRFMFFVVSMDPPIRQGQTRYPFLILQFERDEEMTCSLNLTEDELENKYKGKLKAEMAGALFEVVSRVLKEICGKKITVPGNFKGHTHTSSITCSYKAASGLLYPLERAFMFVHKPPVHVRFDEISYVNFARGQSTGRTFDFEIELKNGSQTSFSNVPREEYSALFDFVSQKSLRIKNKGGKNEQQLMDDLIHSDDDDNDQYLKQMKREGQEAEEGDDNDSDTDDEEDEDYNPDGEKQGDVLDEYDSNVEDSGLSSSDEDSDGTTDPEAKKQKLEDRKKKKEAAIERAMERADKPKKAKRSKKEGTPKSVKRKSGKKKDKNAPKRPMSAYFFWMNEHRDEIKKTNPDASIGDIARAAGEMWKTITDKSEWEEKAKLAKEQYEIDIAAYKKKKAEEAGSEVEEEEKPKKEKKKSTGSKQGGAVKRKSAPQTENSKIKSAEYISTSEDDSDADGEDEVKSEPPPAKKQKESAPTEEEDEDDDFEVEKDNDSGDEEEEGKKEKVGITARRGKSTGKEEKLEELPEVGSGEEEEEAEFSDGKIESSSSEDEDEEDDE